MLKLIAYIREKECMGEDKCVESSWPFKTGSSHSWHVVPCALLLREYGEYTPWEGVFPPKHTPPEIHCSTAWNTGCHYNFLFSLRW